MHIIFHNIEKTEAPLNTFFDDLLSSNPQTKYLKVFHHKEYTKELESLQNLATQMRSRFKNVLLIAMGGAVNNPLSVIGLGDDKLKIIPLNTTDSTHIKHLIANLDLRDTMCLTISNTGGTTETNAVTGYLCTLYQVQNLPLNEHMFFITGAEKSILRDFAQSINAVIINHEENIGGRFSFFGPTAYLPAMLCGIDVKALIDGANSVIDDIHENLEKSQPAISAQMLNDCGKSTSVIMAYNNNLSALLDLYIQLVAESLGKNGKGIMPIKALGPLDQHSLLQLFLDGPKDKVFTIINCANESANYVAENYPSDLIAGKSLEQIHSALYVATKDSLIAINAPLRAIELPQMSAYEFGKLLMFFYAEVIMSGYLMQINPFDQPGVEQIKIRTKKILS